VVINRNSQFLLGSFLSDYVLIQILLQLERPRKFARCAVALFMAIVLDDRIAYRDTFIANVCPGIIAGGGDEFANYILTFVTKRTAEGIVRSGALQAGSPIKREIERSLALIGRIFITSISTVCLFYVRDVGGKYGLFVLAYQACF
jgi:hypothetical protein